MEMEKNGRLSIPWLKILKVITPYIIFFVALITAWNNVLARQTALEKDHSLLNINFSKREAKVESLKGEIGLINQKLATIQADIKHTLKATDRIENFLIAKNLNNTNRGP